MTRRWAACAVALVLCVPATAGEHAGESDKALSGVYKTEHLDVRYRPSSRAGASVERTGAAAERDLARICTQLEVKNDTRYSLFLFDDVAELWAVTKTSGNGGFSGGDSSYLPYDNDQTRTHEMVHLVGHAKVGDPRSLFFAEGLANALLEHVHGVHVHAVAKYYRKAGKLPPLAEMTGAADFYAWLGQHAGLNAYDVAASWMKFLLDAHGIAKVKQYYLGKPAKQVFGSDETALEKAWLAALDKYELRPEVEALLKIRDGQVDAGVTPSVLDEKDGWTTLLSTGGPRSWTRKDGALVGTTEGYLWSVYEFEQPMVGNCVVQAKVRAPGNSGVQMRLGEGNQAMTIPGQGTFVYRNGECVASAPAKPPAAEFEMVLIRNRGVLEVWLDGKKVVSTSAAAGESRVGVGVVFGTATFHSIRMRPLN